jgi:hypothetical protein
MSEMKKISLLGFAILFATAPLQAQTDLQRAKAALPRAAARELEQTVANARKRGLPTEPLIDKALEGVAKRVPPSVIMTAVRHRVALLARADAALRPFGRPPAADVTSTADALQRGVSVDVVKRVRAGRRKGEPVGIALHTVADLMDRKVPAPVAVDVINSWRKRGGRNEELRELPAEVERLIREGATPSAAGRSVANEKERLRRGSGGRGRDRADPRGRPPSAGNRPSGQPGKKN